MDLGTDGFGDLLHQAEQLTAEMDSGTDLPRVERNLQQILETGQRLWTRTAQISQDATDVKASILLGSKGFDVPRISQKLEGLSAAKTFEPLEPILDTDVQGFLRNERENTVLAVIEQTRNRTFEEAEKRHWECAENEWEREKQKILNALIGAGQELDLQPESESILGESISMHGRSALDNVEMAYARQVFAYNDQIIKGGLRPNLVEMFSEVAQIIDDKNIIELWEMVRFMVDVPVASGTSIQNTRTSRKTQQGFVRQARKYLEQNYVKYITTTIYGNLQQAQLGGIPGTYHLVRSFLNVKQMNLRGLEDGTVEGHPVWAMLYYCLRCGDLKAAQQVVDKAPHNLGEHFPNFLQEYSSYEGHRLSPSNETMIRLQYRRAIKNSSDPYKRAVYCVIGQCDFSEDHTEVADKIDDYLWVKLCHIHPETNDMGSETFTLQRLQSILYEDYGESHFNAYHQPHLYFQVLWLTAQFEAALEFLSRIEKLRSHAVHVALALHELHILHTPHTIQAQMLSKDSSDPDPLRRLNIARLIMMYTRKFEATDPREALQYFYFLRGLRTSQGENLFMSCISELVQETREFDMLLGRLEADGTRRPGVIDKFHGDTQKIIELVAKDTEVKGLLEDSIKLYDLAGKHDKVLELLNKLLGQVVSQPSSAQSSRDRVKNLAVSVAQRYRATGHDGNQSNSVTFYLLLDLVTFFDLYNSGNYDQAIEVMQELKLLPLTTDLVEGKVNDFKHYTVEVRKCLPDILLATMNIVLNKYKNAKNTSLQSPGGRLFGAADGGKETYLNYLRSQARALIMFTGMLPYRMPGDTNARLVQIEVLMN
ncbi:nuclear pore complex protein Nup93-like [Liolophura sinensis]|uniref:nuclear pore complex protein Nup93-like n=1 Tax=Liolophura sinensis TaxID=3198878 RepID=UPI0031581D6E